MTAYLGIEERGSSTGGSYALGAGDGAGLIAGTLPFYARDPAGWTEGLDLIVAQPGVSRPPSEITSTPDV